MSSHVDGCPLSKPHLYNLDEHPLECRCIELEERGCGAVVVQGRMYMNNGDPGYPDEYCDNPAEPGSDYCSKHEGFDDHEEFDADEAWKQMKMGDEY